MMPGPWRRQPGPFPLSRAPICAVTALGWPPPGVLPPRFPCLRPPRQSRLGTMFRCWPFARGPWGMTAHPASFFHSPRTTPLKYCIVAFFSRFSAGAWPTTADGSTSKHRCNALVWLNRWQCNPSIHAFPLPPAASPPDCLSRREAVRAPVQKLYHENKRSYCNENN
jgi:hypothetical protein